MVDIKPTRALYNRADHPENGIKRLALDDVATGKSSSSMVCVFPITVDCVLCCVVDWVKIDLFLFYFFFLKSSIKI